MANTHSTDLELSSSQFWSIADASQTGLDFTDAMSIMGWIKIESALASGDNRGIVGKFLTAGDQRSYIFAYINEGGTTRFLFQASTDGTDAALYFGVRDVSLSTGTWYHVAMTKSGTTLRFYVDSTQQGADITLGQSTIKNGTAAFHVGARQTTDYFWDGLMDDVMVFNAQLTGTNVSDYFGDPCNWTPPASLQGRWLFDNDATDSSGNGNTLTGNGSPTFVTDIAYTCGGGGGATSAQAGFLSLCGVGN